MPLTGLDIHTGLAAWCMIESDWLTTLKSIALDVINQLDPDVMYSNDSSNLLSFIKIKKVPGATPAESRIFSGVACTGHVMRREMRDNIKDANVLLLDCPLEYERMPSKPCNLQV